MKAKMIEELTFCATEGLYKGNVCVYNKCIHYTCVYITYNAHIYIMYICTFNIYIWLNIIHVWLNIYIYVWLNINKLVLQGYL